MCKYCIATKNNKGKNVKRKRGRVDGARKAGNKYTRQLQKINIIKI